MKSNKSIESSRLTLKGLAGSKAQRFIDEVERMRGNTNLNAEWIYNRIKRLLLPGNYIACETCGMATTFEGITIDHKVPRAAHKSYEGNIHGVENLQLICSTCNSLKGQKTLPEFLDFLRDRNDKILHLKKNFKPGVIVAPLFPSIGVGQEIFGMDTSIKRISNGRKHKNKKEKKHGNSKNKQTVAS